MTDREQRVRAIQLVAETLGHQFSDLGVEGYLLALDLCRTEALVGAVPTLLREGKWMPKPSEWIEAANAWWKQETGRRAEARRQTHGLEAPAGPMIPLDEQRANVLDMLSGLKRKLGWSAPEGTVVDLEARKAEAKERLKGLGA